MKASDAKRIRSSLLPPLGWPRAQRLIAKTLLVLLISAGGVVLMTPLAWMMAVISDTVANSQSKAGTITARRLPASTRCWTSIREAAS